MRSPRADIGRPKYATAEIKDRGCRYSEGVPCQGCPFDVSRVIPGKRCLEELFRVEWSMFHEDWKINKAQRWRRNGVDES